MRLAAALNFVIWRVRSRAPPPCVQCTRVGTCCVLFVEMNISIADGGIWRRIRKKNRRNNFSRSEAHRVYLLAKLKPFRKIPYSGCGVGMVITLISQLHTVKAPDTGVGFSLNSVPTLVNNTGERRTSESDCQTASARSRCRESSFSVVGC